MHEALAVIPAFANRSALVALACLILCGAGCSTPGVNHSYVASSGRTTIIDVLTGAQSAEIDTFPTADNELLGIAYDPFTDHLFLRIAPGDFIRVIDRPAGKIKRSFYIRNLPSGPGDLAIRSIDRHLFLAHPTLPAVIEITPLGGIVRTIPLQNLQSPPSGVAYDQKQNRLLILQGGDLAHVGIYDLSGKRLAGVSLDRNVRLTSLAYDSDAAEFYAPLLDQPAVGIFNAKGNLVRTLPSPAGGADEFIDVGPRSLIRMF